MNNKQSLMIIGSGPAGYTAAIYAARANLKPIIITGPLKGGQLTTTTEVENYPGFPNGVNGTDLMRDMHTQVINLGVEVIEEIVSDVTVLSDNKIQLTTTYGGEEYISDSVIIATGSSPKKLGVEGEDESWSRGGISTCATCDGFFYRNAEVCVVGGGDTALEEAIYLSNICSKVHLYVRGTKVRGSQILLERVLSISNIEVHYETSITKFIDDEGTKKGIIVHKKDIDTSVEVYLDGIFIAVGSTPNTSFLKNSGISLDEQGYIINPESGSTKTNVLGVYSAGDVSDSIFKQAIISAGSGSKAAIEVQHYLNH